MENVNDTCLLCGSSPKEGMHITGQKKIKETWLPYQLCKECCRIDDNNNEGQISRKKVWINVEKQLMKMNKLNKK